VAGRWLVAVWAGIAGCSFQAGRAGQQPQADAARGDGGARDAGGSDGGAGLDAAIDAAPQDSISIAVTSFGNTPLDIDLTGSGTVDWAHWGLTTATTFDHKNVATHAIGDLASPPAGNFQGAPLTASWTDGTPDPTELQTSTGVGVHQGAAMTFQVLADGTPHTLTVYAGVLCASAQLTVSLSDDASQHDTESLSNQTATDNAAYAITYTSATAGAHLIVSWADMQDFSSCAMGDNGIGFIALLSATLAAH
jgi:hypothetical protein